MCLNPLEELVIILNQAGAYKYLRSRLQSTMQFYCDFLVTIRASTCMFYSTYGINISPKAVLMTRWLELPIRFLFIVASVV